MQGVVDDVLSDPTLLALVLVALRAVVAWQRGLTYTEFRLAHLAKNRVFTWLNPLAKRYYRERGLINTKRTPDGAMDYVTTVSKNPRAVSRRIIGDLSPHLLATAKRRWYKGSLQFAHSQWRKRHGDGTQTEVYLFDNGDGSTDVYAHLEGEVEDPDDHLTGGQTAGDPRNVFPDAYGRHT